MDGAFAFALIMLTVGLVLIWAGLQEEENALMGPRPTVAEANRKRAGEVRPRMETPTYKALHSRLRRDVGAPEMCSRDPEHDGPFEWSLTGEGTLVGPRGERYSTNYDDYDPACRRCNRAESNERRYGHV